MRIHAGTAFRALSLIALVAALAATAGCGTDRKDAVMGKSKPSKETPAVQSPVVPSKAAVSGNARIVSVSKNSRVVTVRALSAGSEDITASVPAGMPFPKDTDGIFRMVVVGEPGAYRLIRMMPAAR